MFEVVVKAEEEHLPGFIPATGMGLKFKFSKVIACRLRGEQCGRL